MRNQRATTTLILALCLGCAATPAPDEFESRKQAMKQIAEEFVEATMPLQLGKDAAAVDFDTVHSGAMRCIALFTALTDEKSRIYLEDAKDRTAADAAASWFRDIAAAARSKQQPRLVDLYRQKRTICGGCHDY